MRRGELLFVSQAVYGLRLHANMPLPGLSPRSDSEAYDVRVWLKDWTTFPKVLPEFDEVIYTSTEHADCGLPNLRVGVFPDGEHFGFFYRDGVRFAVERAGREIWADWPPNYTLEDACTYLIGPVIGFVLRLRGVTSLHAGAIAIGDGAIALVGCPGAGKSTTAAAFAKLGFPVITDDVVALGEEGQDFLVPPGYPRVNLWPDSVCSLFGSEEALPRITPTWEKRFMILGNDGLSFARHPLPLRAIYLLGERETDKSAPVVEGVTPGDDVLELLANTYVNYLLDRDMRAREFDVLSRVAARVPIRRVRPTTNLGAVFELCRAIASDAIRLTDVNAASSRQGRSNV